MQHRLLVFLPLLCLFVLLDWPADLRADDRIPLAQAEFFETEIRPLLAERCFKCYGGLKTKANLRFTSRASLLHGGDTGPAAIPGKPAQSLLIQAVRHENGLRMPPGEKLKPPQIEKLVRWVELRLPWPKTQPDKAATAARQGSQYEPSEEQRRSWSFQPVQVVSPPAVKEVSWPRSPIDRFILARLGARGLHPAPAADKRTLLRRATFDLTGLPPTTKEIEAFLADHSCDAYTRVVDRLLASPAYGERWGRHWLDVVRYTDSFDARIVTGPGTVMDITEAYRYRDWVVDAFNHDLPYDQFIVHQIAGDLLPPPEPGGVNVPGIVATTMLAVGNWGGGDADKEKLLTDIVDDQIDVVSRGFLGLTMACARCHDHKFDPLSTEDYYALAGIFFSCHILRDLGPKTDGPPMLRIPLLPQAELERRKRVETRIAELEKEAQRLTNESRATPASKDNRDSSAAHQAKLAEVKRELEAWKATPLPALEFANGTQEGGCPQSPQAGIHDVRVHIRGRYDRLGKLVSRRFPTILAGDHQQPITEGSGRLQLARWIASPTNPLTARVMVNRIWQYHFGEGLVRTPGNFGKLGEPPTHPKLLDYLAHQFVQAEWSIKALHRAIMHSAAYQQSSVPNRDTLEADPDNRLWGRMNRQRMQAEEIRDALLAAAGRLDRAMRGRASQDFNRPRRTVYLMTIRSDRSSFRDLFDAADPTAITDRRVVSTVAPQALFLMNNAFVQEQARTFARRITEGPGDQCAKITRAYTVLYGRPPTARELAIGLQFTRGDRTAWEEYCEVLLWANEFVMID
jgi:hypothetical protein